MWFVVVGGYMGRLAMIKSIPVGNFVCRSLGVTCIVSSGSDVFHWVVAEGGSWRGYFSLICVIRCWIDVCASGYVSAHAYVLIWYPALRRTSKPVAVPP